MEELIGGDETDSGVRSSLSETVIFWEGAWGSQQLTNICTIRNSGDLT